MEKPWYLKKWKREEYEPYPHRESDYKFQSRQYLPTYAEYQQGQYQYEASPADEATMKRLTYRRIFYLVFGILCLRLMFRSMFIFNVQYKKGKILEITHNCMPDKDKKTLNELFYQFVNVAEKHNLTYFLHYGSLLGSWRHHGRIPWDDDIDVAVSVRDREKVLTIVNQDLNPYFVALDTGDRTRSLKFYSNEHSAMIPDKTWKWPFVDISFYTENKTHIWDTFGPDSHRKYLKTEVFPLTKRPFEGRMVYCPKNTRYVIRKMFGNENICAVTASNHLHEDLQPHVIRVECSELKDRFPFVERHEVNGKVYEKFKTGYKLVYEDQMGTFDVQNQH